jgi:cell division protein FtsL
MEGIVITILIIFLLTIGISLIVSENTNARLIRQNKALKYKNEILNEDVERLRAELRACKKGE